MLSVLLDITFVERHVMNESHPDVGEKSDALRASPKEEATINRSMMLVAGLGALAVLWLNVSFVLSIALSIAKAIATFFLVIGGCFSALLMFRPRRIVTADQTAEGTTIFQVMVQALPQSPFIWNANIRNPEDAGERNVTSWELRKLIMFESSACFSLDGDSHIPNAYR